MICPDFLRPIRIAEFPPAQAIARNSAMQTLRHIVKLLRITLLLGYNRKNSRGGGVCSLG